MDWKYILSIAQSADELEENKKDELLNTIAWHDFGEEKIDIRKYSALLRISQEVMKYKSEQVDALLAELDELAIKQAEEEAKTNESDERSSRSKKSLDSDDQDMKYRQLKSKYRKLQKQLETHSDEYNKLKQNVKMLEQERVYLQKELRHAHRDDSASDISESVKDQQRNLLESVQQKNTQISQLLTDIENVESDNLQMRAHLSSLRDELADATEKLETLMDENKLWKLKWEETNDSYEKLKLENASLKGQIEDFIEDKEARELEFEQFAKEIDVRIEDWKRVLDAKNKEIDQLKSKTNQTFTSGTRASSSSSSNFVPADETQLNALQRAIFERDENNTRLQKQLETATKEMLKTTQVLQHITGERDSFNKKCDKMNTMIKELKKQLKAAHGRCQELIEDVQYQENLVESKDNDIDELVKKIEDSNLKKILKELEQIKSEKRAKEKKLSDLVKSYNKMKNASENFEKENATLRERLGLTEDDFISTKCINNQQKRHRKQLEQIKLKCVTSEEEKLQYRIELQKLSKIVSNLSDQLLDLGEIPIIDEVENLNLKFKDKDELEMRTSNATKVEYTTLLEENDALRKGLHEILESVQTKQESSVKEIKSETLESLLRALDAKHVSGWYHPAMRLQAEVHTLQGSNIALREQLRIIREELERYKEKDSNIAIIDYPLDSSNATAIANLNNHLVNVLKNYHVDDENNVKLLEKLENYKKEFLLIQEQVGVLYNQYTEEKSKWENDLETCENKITDLIDIKDSFEKQLKVIKLFTDPETEDEIKIKTTAEMSAKLITMNRKVVYMENMDLQYNHKINKLKNQLLQDTQDSSTKINKLKEENSMIKLHVEKIEQTCSDKFIFTEDVVKLQNDYDNLLIKQRESQRIIDDASRVARDELELLNKKVILLEKEKDELARKLVSTKCHLTGDDLQKRLAQSEINETTERQRANHTNSLYELVKEQLAKSEERHKEFQKYNNEIMQKNLLLQESVKELEDKVLNYVDAKTYNALDLEREKLVDNCQQHTVELCSLRDELNVLRKDMVTRSLWTNLDQYEFHSLKHQIVDLQATGDDKAVIARLSSDVVMARMSDAEIRKKLDEMVAELAICKNDNDVKIASLTNANSKCKLTIETLRRKISHLESIIKQQRNHYLGYVPFISQEKLITKIKEISEEKKRTHEALQRTEQIENDCHLIKETLESKTDVLNELNQMIKNGDEQSKALEKWFLDKMNVQLQELRCRRQSEFKETQLKHALARLQDQEEQIAQLEAELLQSLCLRDPKEIAPNENVTKEPKQKTTEVNTVEGARVTEDNQPVNTVVETVNAHCQTTLNNSFNNCDDPSLKTVVNKLQMELDKKNEEICTRSEELQCLKQKLLELEMNISLLRQQMGDKQSQITFYEKHIMEMQQNKKEAQTPDVINQLQQTLIEKEQTIFELQSLLKKDRDEHSLAAVRFQEELKHLQSKITQQDHVTDTQKEKPARVAIEYYIQQVHALEKLTTELQTSVSTLSTQLQSCREECVRWRTLASNRLQSVDELRIQLEEQHKNELEAYKSECEKWRSEVNNLQHYINAYKKDIIELRPNIEKELKDKDNKIHELLITLRQLKTELRRKTNNQPTSSSVRISEENFEDIKENLLKEQEVLKKRCEQLFNKEKSAREEIRSLKGQLMKRPIVSARSESTGIKEQQQQRKIQSLEKEVDELKEKLEREVGLNEAHKAKVNVDFEKWSKQKYWQQNAEKMRTKLKEKTDECEKLQQTSSSYRMLIERLEREKHNLEVRVKNLKGNLTACGSNFSGSIGGMSSARYEVIESENAKLQAEINILKTKLEQQQHHSGALSSAMLQDKLEAQERKIAILEMSAKGGGELRSELERLQNSNSTLQKCNLRLEAETIELRLNLEKSTNELPHLREQINYLDNYIKVLKNERSDEHHEVTNSGDHLSVEPKRVAELERTVFVLKRIVEKLQVENKRLLGGGNRPSSAERAGSVDRTKRECNQLKEQYDEKIASLEAQLQAANQKVKNCERNDQASLREELDMIKGQLKQKAELLDKVKVLLQRAAVKEKALLDQVSSLKAMIDAK